MSKRKSSSCGHETTDDRLKRRRSEEDEDFDLSQNPDFDVNEVDQEISLSFILWPVANKGCNLCR